jgi:signal transduction histidine kinase
MVGYSNAPLPLRARAAWRLLSGGPLGWRDPQFLAARPGRERAFRLLSMLLILQRVSYAVAGVTSLFGPAGTSYRSELVNLLLVLGIIAWNVGVVLGIRQARWFGTPTIVADTLVNSLLVVLGALNIGDPAQADHVNWPVRFALASAALIGASMPLARGLLLSGPPLLAAGFAMVQVTGSVRVSWLVGHFNSFLWFAVILYFLRRYLLGQAAALEDMAARRLVEESRRMSERAVFAARIEHYRALHDTALSTLTAIARGGLDHREDAVRQRCANDADLVRRLIDQDLRQAFTDLADRLTAAVHHATGIGLRVRFQHDRLPADLPGAVVDAVADAAVEALNNVAKHSGATDAWLTAWWEDETLTVRVVDRGIGFDLAARSRGFGLRWSIGSRMADAGGESRVISAPGEGTCVELEWRASVR